MTSYLVDSSGAFAYPDHLFPEVVSPFPGLPPSPVAKAAKLMDQYQQHADNAAANVPPTAESKQLLFRWARDTLDFAERHPGLPDNVISTALDIIRLASTENNKYKFKGAALYLLGLWCLYGLFGYPVNAVEARQHFMASAQLGYSRSLYRLASDFEAQGDMTMALTYFEHGVKRNDAACYYRLGMALLRGHFGLAPDSDQGFKHLARASVMSDPDCPQASYVYGLLLMGELSSVYEVEDWRLDTEQGALALERSAWLGFIPAQIRMGREWQGGLKGYDAAVALRYFHLSSRQVQYGLYRGIEVQDSFEDSGPGSGGASEVEISKWMLCGSDGVFAPNEEWAYKFSMIASAYQNPIAEFAVGYFHEVGIYVPSDLDAAVTWYRTSASHECEDAIVRLKELGLEKDQESGPVELSRQLTRNDHDKTMTLRGRGSIRRRRTNSTEAGNGDQVAAFEFEKPLSCVEESETSSDSIRLPDLDQTTPVAPPHSPNPMHPVEQPQAYSPIVPAHSPVVPAHATFTAKPDLDIAKRDYERPPIEALSHLNLGEGGSGRIVSQTVTYQPQLLPDLELSPFELKNSPRSFSVPLAQMDPGRPAADFEPTRPDFKAPNAPSDTTVRNGVGLGLEPYHQPPTPMVDQVTPPIDSNSSMFSRASTMTSQSSWSDASFADKPKPQTPNNQVPLSSAKLRGSPGLGQSPGHISAPLPSKSPAPSITPSMSASQVALNIQLPPPNLNIPAQRSPLGYDDRTSMHSGSEQDLEQSPRSPRRSSALRGPPARSRLSTTRGSPRSVATGSGVSLQDSKAPTMAPPLARPSPPVSEGGTPLTFDDMGVPRHKDSEKDCVVM